jgi:hypothetical protein
MESPGVLERNLLSDCEIKSEGLDAAGIGSESPPHLVKLHVFKKAAGDGFNETVPCCCV